MHRLLKVLSGKRITLPLTYIKANNVAEGDSLSYIEVENTLVIVPIKVKIKYLGQKLCGDCKYNKGIWADTDKNIGVLCETPNGKGRIPFQTSCNSFTKRET